VKKLLKRFGFKLVRIADEPCEIVQAFAMEIDWQVRGASNREVMTATSRYFLMESLRSLLRKLEDEVYDDCPGTWLIRDAAACLAVAALRVAQVFGELLPKQEKPIVFFD